MIAQPLFLSRPLREADALAHLLARIEQELGRSQTYAQAIASLQGLLGQAAPSPEPSPSRRPLVQTVDVAVNGVSVDLPAGPETATSIPAYPPVSARPSSPSRYDGFIRASRGDRDPAPEPPRRSPQPSGSPSLAWVTIDQTSDPTADWLVDPPNGAARQPTGRAEPPNIEEAPAEWLRVAHRQPGAIGVWPLPEPQPVSLGAGQKTNWEETNSSEDMNSEGTPPFPNPFDSAVDLLERLFELPAAVTPRPVYSPFAPPLSLVLEAQPSTIPVDEAWRQACQAIGQRLHAARLAKGWNLERLYTTTFVPQHHIQSLEEGWIDRLPEPIYVRGFVRRLAEALELDSLALLAELPKSSVASLPHWQVLSGDEPLGLVQPWHVYAGYVAVVAGGVGWMAQSAVAPLVPPLKPTVIDPASYVPPASSLRSQREFQKLPTGEALETFVAPPEVLTP